MKDDVKFKKPHSRGNAVCLTSKPFLGDTLSFPSIATVIIIALLAFLDLHKELLSFFWGFLYAPLFQFFGINGESHSV